MVRTSPSSGTFGSVNDSAVSSDAASAGNAAFFAALTATFPFNGTPPSITRRAGISQTSRPRSARPRAGPGAWPLR